MLKISTLIFILTLVSQAAPLSAAFVGTDLFKSTSVKVELRDGKTKVFLFLSARCPCSESHEILLAKLANEFKAISFIAIHSNANESWEESKIHFKAANLPFAVLQDSDAKIADDFKALKTPHAFVVDGKGEIVYSGGVTETTHAPTAKKQYLREALLSIEAGQKVDPREVRVLGCRIERP